MSTQIQQLPSSLEHLVESIRQTERLSPQKLKSILTESRVDQADLEKWAAYEHPPQDSYGRTLIYDGGYFEVMAMSWQPGDYSAIHDHGHTVWGAVQIFGAAEHAIYSFDEEKLVTLNRVRVTPGRVLAVNHDLIHQMGNPTDERFMSLHIYGNDDRSSAITSDARIFDLANEAIAITDGGVFFGLPSHEIKELQEGPQADYFTWLFDIVKHIKRKQMAGEPLDHLLQNLVATDRWELLKSDLAERTDDHGHTTDSRYWQGLVNVLEQASKLQSDLLDQYSGDSSQQEDIWRTYASYYDHVIGTTNAYIPKYLTKVFEEDGIDPQTARLLDVGCGTGWLETELVGKLGFSRDRVLAVDPSPGMLSVAKQRAEVRQAGLLEIDENYRDFEITFCNSYQYLDHADFERAVQNMLAATKVGGHSIAEFITYDHVRWYPNVIYSEDDLVVTLRTPTLHEADGFTYQESNIINVSRIDGMRITHEGVHRRFLLSPHHAFRVFRSCFGENVRMFDAINLTPMSEKQETCASTRYVIVAKRTN